MLKLKFFLKKNKILIMITLIILICSIAIAFGVYAQITNRGAGKRENSESDNFEDLKSNFESIFNNSINKEATAKLNINYEELLYTRNEIKETKEGEYSIDAKIPEFKEENEILKNINAEIIDTFAKEIIKIGNNSSINVTYNLDYVAYVNNNIISLAIICKYKDGANPQRKIVQTYNYDLENNKL